MQLLRFAGLFTDKNFEVDTTEEAYRLLNPVVTKLDKAGGRVLLIP